MIRTLVLLLLTVPTTMAQATFHGDVARAIDDFKLPVVA